MLPAKLKELDDKRIDDPAGVIESLRSLLPNLNEGREVVLAFGVYGSCLRHIGQISEALEMIGDGLELATEVWDRAHLLHRKALAVGATGDLNGAVSASEEALLGYFRVGDADGMGRIMTDQGMWSFHQENYLRCLEVNSMALRLLDHDNLSNRFTCYQGSALAAAEMKDFGLCLEHLKKARPIAKELGHFSNSSFLWLEAKLSLLAGREDLATKAFRSVRDALFQAKEYLDAALASVALVETLLARGRVEDSLKEGVNCRQFLLHLPERSFAVPILAAIWKQAEAKALSQEFLRNSIARLKERASKTPAKKHLGPYPSR